MVTNRQENRQRPTTLVGMDAHSRKLSVCVTDWTYGTDPDVRKRITDFGLDNMENVYLKNVPRDSLTVLEASTNAFSIVKRLGKIGYKAVVVYSDILRGLSRKDHINDRIDAEKLAVAYARFGGTRTHVHVPSDRFAAYRDILFGYRNTVKDATRAGNRIWGFCSAHGMPLPKRSRERKVEDVRAWLAKNELDPLARFQIEDMLESYEYVIAKRNKYEKTICRIVSENKDMRSLLQVPGIGIVVAFALVAYVEDIRRFPTPAKLVAYIGLNPCVNSSGEEDDPHKMSTFGQRELKALLVQSGQCLLRRQTEHGIGRWARAKVAAGKPYLCMCIAAARKDVVYCWHILMGHPAPDRESESRFTVKLVKLFRTVGAEEMAKLGYATSADFAARMSEPVYSHLP